jgi:hypothetical protein
MAIFGIFDLLAGGGVIVGFIAGLAATIRLRSTGSVVALCACGVALVLFVLFNVAYFNGFGTDPVIGSPTRAQVTGTWVGDYGAVLVLRPDGTFTASGLPPDVGDVTSGTGASSPGQNLLSGRGTWIIGPGAFNGPPQSVIFTFSCGVGPNGCPADVQSFDLQAEASSPSGGGGPALFYYLGDPDDWSNQYPFGNRRE